ncbi:MAG: topoisomerase DNA-binding C4 zinc finger domain-containing protein [Proteobacteria bacterium]|nr:topoisomerase DNA-binding C4 zinc finger domain-containing protein [Pseudomonadota bacterium]
MRIIYKHPIISCIAVFVVLFMTLGWLFGPTKCNDGWASSSIGHRGACSHHHGVDKSKGFFVFLLSLGGAIAVGRHIYNVYEADEVARRKEQLEAYMKSPNYKPPKVCPECGSAMRERTAQKGKHRGNKFYGCTRYPLCKGILNV